MKSSKSLRRLAITGPHQVEILEYEDPPLQAGQVLVKTEIASGKHGTTKALFDNLNYQGQRFDPAMRLFLEGETEAEPPFSRDNPLRIGTTGVGVVSAVGPEVSRWHVGDRVLGLMDVRETNICAEDRLWNLGEIEPHLALCIEPAYVAFHCIREANVRFGETVAVIGLGAIGLLAVRMAVQGGAEKVFALDPLPGRRAWAIQNGAHAAFNPREGDVALEIHRLTDGAGVDVAIELAGVYPALQTAIRCTRMTGTVCSAGFYQGEAGGMWLGREWHHNRLTMLVPHGCGWGHPPRDFPRWDQKRAYDSIVSMMHQGQLTAPGLIQPVISLEDGPEIFRLIENEPDKVIKYAVQF
jgi:threonine dehydrogenase-like Zn-dependent dehydrogenase